MTRKKRRYFIGLRKGAGALARIAGVASAVSGCAVGPNFNTPDAPETTSYTPEQITKVSDNNGGDIRLLKAGEIPRKWWETFHNQKLNTLVASAIEHNQSLEAAEASIRIA